MATSDIWTHADVFDFLVDQFGLQSQSPQIRRLARVAIRTAYRDLPSDHDWAYLQRRGQISLSAPYATGTIAYDHTGGSSERLVTLSGGAFPAWARYGSLLIGTTFYKVASNPTSTTLTLDELTNPGDDVAAGTAYTLARIQYPLPNGFKKIASLSDLNNQLGLEYIDPSALHQYSVLQKSTGQPRYWTIRGVSIDYPGQVAMEVHPPASSARTLDFLMENACRELLLPTEHDVGTIVSSGTSITGTSTSFPAGCVGAIIRFGTDDKKPSPLWGDNAYTHQSVITARSSDTAITIADAPATDVSGVKYTISDPIDVNPGPMTTYFLKSAAATLSILLNVKPDMQLMLRNEKIDALRAAMAADHPMVVIPAITGPEFSLWSLRDWRSDA